MAESLKQINLLGDEELLKDLEDFIAVLRAGCSMPMNFAAAQKDPQVLTYMQNVAMHAGVIFAGMTAGHLSFFGALDKDGGDIETIKQECLSQWFDFGVEQGIAEAQKAAVADGVGRG